MFIYIYEQSDTSKDIWTKSWTYSLIPEAYWKRNRISKMQLYARIVLTIFVKSSILHVPLGSEYASALVLYVELMTINLLLDIHVCMLLHFHIGGLHEKCFKMSYYSFVDLISRCLETIIKMKPKKQDNIVFYLFK